MQNEEDFPINRWWHFVRPYWHIAAFLVTITAIVTGNWTKVEAYDTRLIAVEGAQKTAVDVQQQQGRDIAVMRQQISDIHDLLIPRASANRSHRFY